MTNHIVQRFLRRVRSKGEYFRLLIALFGLILLAIASVEFFLYSASSTALTEQISSQKIQTLQQTRNSTDVNLKDIEKLLISAATDSRILNFTSDPFGQNYYWTNQAITVLREFKNAYRYLYSVYIYNPLYQYLRQF